MFGSLAWGAASVTEWFDTVVPWLVVIKAMNDRHTVALPIRLQRAREPGSLAHTYELNILRRSRAPWKLDAGLWCSARTFATDSKTLHRRDGGGRDGTWFFGVGDPFFVEPV